MTYMKLMKNLLIKLKYKNYNKIPLTLLKATYLSKSYQKENLLRVTVTNYDEYNCPAYQCERFYKKTSRCF
jgi:hypothetical protein